MTAPSFDFEGRSIGIEAGDTIASSLYRAGVRTFSRSFKYHRRRGLYCVTGDCPNCLLNVDGEACVRACVTEARGGEVVRRENGWPSVEHDLLRVADHVRRLLPVGFYYKTLLRPAWLWPKAEPWLRRVAGLGDVDLDATPAHREAQHASPDVLVIGAGPAGLAAAATAAAAGETVILCDEGRIGDLLPDGETRDVVDRLVKTMRSDARVTVLENAPAVGIYSGPLVPVNAPDRLVLVRPRRIVVATGAVEQHVLFDGNDLPGVFLARGAARLAGRHGVAPGRVAVAVVDTDEGCANLATTLASGLKIAAAIVPERLAPALPEGVRAIVDGTLVRARGRGRVRSVVIATRDGRRRISCDTVILAAGLVPRDGLLRQAGDLPVVAVGDVAEPGCTLSAALESGRRQAQAAQPPANVTAAAGDGFVCICEDVTTHDLDTAWREGFRSNELLKRYTTATMGPCQGALCQRHLAAFTRERLGDSTWAQLTTARPPTRSITLEEIAAGSHAVIERRTRLDARHVEHGATMEPAGAWRRPSHYGDATAEYWAVREGVSLMDVGTLGKYVIHGRDAARFLEQLYPCRVEDLAAGRIRYALLLAETGYAIDDGLICADGNDGRSWYLTFTSGGADHAEAWLRDWKESWGLDVHVVNRTAAIGAINVAGPKARDLLSSLTDADIDNASFPYLHHREIVVAGVRCRAIRLGFLGELSYELHHPSSQSVELWDALMDAGQAYDVRPHGLEALRLLRLEKGHIIVDQDTEFDATPEKLGLRWAARMDKPYFVGKSALERISSVPDTKRLVALRFDGGAPPEGSSLTIDGDFAGYLTSSRYSPSLECGVALGWLMRRGEPSQRVESAGLPGVVMEPPLYDAAEDRLRA